MAGEDPFSVRRLPQQERSVQRVETILSTAAELIALHGVAKLKITEVAKKAGLPIGSLYQYFPDKTAIVKALFERSIARARARVTESYASVQSLEQAINVAFEILHWYQNELKLSSSEVAIWLCTETDLELMKFNMEETRLISEIVLKSIEKFLPVDLVADMEARTFLISYLTSSVLKLALLSDQEMSQRLLREWKAIILLTVFRQGAAVTIPEAYDQRASVVASEMT